MKLYLRNRFLEKPAPLVMGILNVTPDSFSDGGKFLNLEEALRQTGQMLHAGADIIDIGGESTRPGARAIPVEEEMDRVLPLLEKIKREFDVVVSVDTRKADIARMAVEETGADIINDISALRFSERMAETIAKLSVPVVLMHMKGMPETMQENPQYADAVEEIKDFFQERIDFALAKGIKREKLILDPGIGFGKRPQDNLDIIKHLHEFKIFDLPLLIGTSRKTFLGKISGEEVPASRLEETITANVVAIINGAAIIRVHDVAPAVKSIKILQRLL